MMNSVLKDRKLVRTDQPQFLATVLTPTKRVKYLVAILWWIAALAYFWAWWLNPAHYIGAVRFALVTAGIFWMHFLFLYFVRQEMSVSLQRS